MARRIVFVSQWPLDFCLRSRDRNTNTGEHVVHQDIVDMALADQIADEHLRRLFGLFDTLRQTLSANLFGLLLHIANELF